MSHKASFELKKNKRPYCLSTYFNKSLFKIISKTHAIKTVFGHNHISKKYYLMMYVVIIDTWY